LMKGRRRKPALPTRPRKRRVFDIWSEGKKNKDPRATAQGKGGRNGNASSGRADGVMKKGGPTLARQGRDERRGETKSAEIHVPHKKKIWSTG